MLNRTIYGIHSNDAVVFLSLEDAEDYLMKEYPECFCSKDHFMDVSEQMIWEKMI